MNRVFVDTSFLFAFHHVRDPFHRKSRQLMGNMRRDKARSSWQFVITDYVFDEFVTLVQKTASKEEASKVGQFLLEDPNFDLQWITAEYFDEAWNVFVEFRDKMWSFTDCTSYVWIRRNRPDFLLATDADFDQFGLVPNLVR